MNQTSAITTAPGVILIADDSPEARRMLEVRVKREGHHALLVENGKQALNVLAHERVDVILLDIDMPELDGFGVLRTVKNDPKLAHLPVLIISGGGDQEDLVRCIELGAVDFLPKPFNQALLRARINACLIQKRQRDQERQRANASMNDTAPDQPLLSETSEWPAGEPRRPAPAPAGTPSSGSGEAPTRLGRIVIQRSLGQGASGRVYLGHHELLDLPVAVKLLRPELTETSGACERLLREARLAARLAHRHIVRLLEVNEAQQGVYLALEYVSGGTLKDHLDRQPARQLPLAEAVRMTQEIASALVEANRLNIIHRDIKPANLLLTLEAEVKVADFGLARRIEADAADAPQLTMAGAIVGTPLYMAPEQLMLGSAVDIRTDLYALGCVLYEMLTGHAPFGAPAMSETITGTLVNAPSTAHDVFYHQMHTPPQPPTQIRADIPAWMEGVCLKLLAKRPDERFPTPEALLTALRTETSAPSQT